MVKLIRNLQHELELIQMEKKLEEYLGLNTEREIRAEMDLLRVLKTFKLLGVEDWGYVEPPLMGRRYPPLMPGTVSDWDFVTASWTLDTSLYVSSPSSLRYTVWQYQIALCKYAGTYPLDQGRIVSQVRNDGLGRQFGWAFRNNSAIGSASYTVDGYFLNEFTTAGFFETGTTCLFGYYSGGAKTEISVPGYLANGAPPNAAWDKRRITWWVSAGVLIVRLERYYGGAWIKAINDQTDSGNRFTGNPNRRCGVGFRNDVTTNYDDTEIWGP